MTRYETATAVVARYAELRGELTGVTVVRGDDFADALAASSAGSVCGPVGLVRRDDVPDDLATVLNRDEFHAACILGERDVVGPEVESELHQLGASFVDRHAGPDRYATAVAAAELVWTAFYEEARPLPGVVVASGANWPDGLAAGPLAIQMQVPVLLVKPDEVPAVVADFLERVGADFVYVVGGPDAVSDLVAERLGSITGAPVERLAGRDRFETAVAVADRYADPLPGQVRSDAPALRSVTLVRSNLYADAIAGGFYAAFTNGPLLLVSSVDELGEPSREWIESHADEIQLVTVLGTPEVISDAVLEEAVEAAS